MVTAPGSRKPPTATSDRVAPEQRGEPPVDTVAAAPPPVALESETAPFDSPWQIHVSVLNRDLEAEPGAQVSATFLPRKNASPTEGEVPVVRRRTDASGKTILVVPQKGGYHVVVRKDTRAAQHITYTAADAPGVVTLVLSPAGTIEGSVVNASGDPVPGARVEVHQKDFYPFSGSSTPCESDGAFRIEALSPGYYTLRAKAEGYAPGYSEVVQPGVSGLRIGLTPGGRIVGHVIGAGDRKPVEGFGVVAAGIIQEQEQPTAYSDVSGRFAFDHLPDDTYFIRGTESKWYVSSGAKRVEIRNGRADIADVELLVSQGTRVTGVVTGERSGDPVAGVWASIVFLDENWGVNAATGDEGVYELTGIRPGVFRIAFNKGKGPGRSFEVTIPEGEPEVRVDCSWPEGPHIAGTVLDASGAPAPEVEVKARHTSAGGPGTSWHHSAASGTDGNFRIEVPSSADAVEIFAQSPRGRMPRSEVIAVPAEGVDGLALRLEEAGLASVSGIVMDGRNHGILARIRLTRVTVETGLDAQFRESGYSEADGFFMARNPFRSTKTPVAV